MKIFGIKDTVNNNYDERLILARNEHMITREFSDILNKHTDNNSSLVLRFPDSHHLFELGDIDLETGVIIPAECPRSIVCLGDLKMPSPPVVRNEVKGDE